MVKTSHLFKDENHAKEKLEVMLSRLEEDFIGNEQNFIYAITLAKESYGEDFVRPYCRRYCSIRNKHNEV